MSRCLCAIATTLAALTLVGCGGGDPTAASTPPQPVGAADPSQAAPAGKPAPTGIPRSTGRD